MRATPDAKLLGITGGGHRSIKELEAVGRRRELLFNTSAPHLLSTGVVPAAHPLLAVTQEAVRLCSQLEIVNTATKHNIEALSVLSNCESPELCLRVESG